MELSEMADRSSFGINKTAVGNQKNCTAKTIHSASGKIRIALQKLQNLAEPCRRKEKTGKTHCGENGTRSSRKQSPLQKAVRMCWNSSAVPWNIRQKKLPCRNSISPRRNGRMQPEIRRGCTEEIMPQLPKPFVNCTSLIQRYTWTNCLDCRKLCRRDRLPMQN